MTIPRLKLRATLIAARLLQTAAKELDIPVERCHAWTDSQVMLKWLQSFAPTGNSIVDNYVAHVQEIIPNNIWRHVPTQSNPADVASRGIDLPHLHSHDLWWNGPGWLALSPDSWPVSSCSSFDSAMDLPPSTTALSCPVRQHSSTVLDRFSSLGTLLRFIVRLTRYVRHRLNRTPTAPVTSPMSAQELQDAFLACVSLSQSRTFGREIKILHDGGRIPARHALARVGVFLHSDRILRVGGRLQHSALPFAERHPPALSQECPLARLVIAWAHDKALHGGPRVTSAYVSRRAWIIGGQRRIKTFIRHCTICARLNARPATQLMAPLPASRVTPSRAFCRTGVDYAGPFHVLAARGRGIRTTKAYIALFVCLSTKALHLELVGDLTTDSFLGALNRFSGRRGKPSELWSDNATNFRRADQELIAALQSNAINWDAVAGNLAEHGIKWHFIPPVAPHFGGLWEAGVKSVKAHLRRVIGTRRLTYEEFTTILVGIEAVLNSRPLTPLTDDPEDLGVLTPGHFLIGAPLTSIAEALPPLDRIETLTHWNLVRALRSLFWTRWSREYLNTQQQRGKWTAPQRNFAVGDMVILLDSTLLRPNGTWPIGRILAVHPGSDGLVRTVTLKTASGQYVRPITKLTLLPMTRCYAS